MSKKFIALCVFLNFVGYTVEAQDQNFDTVEIKTNKLTESIYMLEGAGGNIGVLVGNDGIILADDQFAPLTEK